MKESKCGGWFACKKKGILRLTVTGFALPLLEANGFFSHSFSRSKDGAHGVVALRCVCDWDRASTMLTINEVIVGTDDSLVESPRIGGGLKGEPVPLLSSAPMMKGRHDFEVLQVSINNTT